MIAKLPGGLFIDLPAVDEVWVPDDRPTLHLLIVAVDGENVTYRPQHLKDDLGQLLGTYCVPVVGFIQCTHQLALSAARTALATEEFKHDRQMGRHADD